MIRRFHRFTFLSELEGLWLRHGGEIHCFPVACHGIQLNPGCCSSECREAFLFVNQITSSLPTARSNKVKWTSRGCRARSTLCIYTVNRFRGRIVAVLQELGFRTLRSLLRGICSLWDNVPTEILPGNLWKMIGIRRVLRDHDEETVTCESKFVAAGGLLGHPFAKILSFLRRIPRSDVPQSFAASQSTLSKAALGLATCKVKLLVVSVNTICMRPSNTYWIEWQRTCAVSTSKATGPWNVVGTFLRSYGNLFSDASFMHAYVVSIFDRTWY